MIGKKKTAVGQARKSQISADALSNAKRLDALRKELEGLRDIAAQAQRWAEEATDKIDAVVYADEQWSEAVQETLTTISGRLEGLEREINARSSAKDVVAFTRGKDGKESLQNLRKEIDCLKKYITIDRDERQQIATHARQWVTLADDVETKLDTINEIVVGLAEVAVSDYYEGARERISIRYRNLWIGFWILTVIVFSATIIPEVGASDSFINFLETRVGVLTILGVALFTLRTSLRRAEKTEKEYETKALRLKTTIAAKDSKLSDNLLKGIAVAIQPDPDDEE